MMREKSGQKPESTKLRKGALSTLNSAMPYFLASILMMTALKISMNLNLSINQINSHALTGGDQPYLYGLTRRTGRTDAAAYGVIKYEYHNQEA